MKSQRHRKIIEIVTQKHIETQEELADELKRSGFNVTQATVSRDIKELRLYKIATGDNVYRYAVPTDKISGGPKKAGRVFRDSIEKVDFSENIVVVKTTPGAAQAVALVIDNEGWREIIGTVAGDDTVMVVVKPRSAVPSVVARLTSYLA